MVIFKTFTFDSAHYLPNVPEDHKCRKMHGHTYRLTVFIEGELHEKYGWLMDFSVLKNAIEPIIQKVDHQTLNQIEGLDNPTCEILAAWLWDRIKQEIPSLKKIQLNETDTSGAIYEG